MSKSNPKELQPNQTQGLSLSIPRFFSQGSKLSDKEVENLKLELTKLNKENSYLKFAKPVENSQQRLDFFEFPRYRNIEERSQF
jgi:hypothetical protein